MVDALKSIAVGALIFAVICGLVWLRINHPAYFTAVAATTGCLIIGKAVRHMWEYW